MTKLNDFKDSRCKRFEQIPSIDTADEGHAFALATGSSPMNAPHSFTVFHTPQEAHLGLHTVHEGVYSSLGLLSHLSIGVLKLDMSFARNAFGETRDLAHD